MSNSFCLIVNGIFVFGFRPLALFMLLVSDNIDLANLNSVDFVAN